MCEKKTLQPTAIKQMVCNCKTILILPKVIGWEKNDTKKIQGEWKRNGIWRKPSQRSRETNREREEEEKYTCLLIYIIELKTECTKKGAWTWKWKSRKSLRDFLSKNLIYLLFAQDTNHRLNHPNIPKKNIIKLFKKANIYVKLRREIEKSII